MDNEPKLPHKDTNTPNNVEQSNKDIPTRTEVENMILKGKSDYLQTLIIVVLTLFALLGAIFPFVTSIVQSGRVEREIDSMETRFKELVGKQLRKPKILCKNGNEQLLNSVLNITDPMSTYNIGIYNEGDGVAGPIDVYIYFKEDNPRLNFDIPTCLQTWKVLPCEEPGYKSKYSIGGYEHLSPQDVFYIPFKFHTLIREDSPDCNAMLEVFYGEQTPIRIPFVLRTGQVKKQSQ